MSTLSQSTDSASADSATSPSLLARVSQHDPAAWERLVALYGPLIFHWLRGQGLSQHDASDVLQDVFASVARSIHQFERRGHGAFRAWLWRITRNQLAGWFRSRSTSAPAAGGTHAWIELAQVAESLPDDPDSVTERPQLTALYERGLEIVRSEFEHRTWQMFWQTAVDDVPAREVAKEFGVAPNTVRQAKSRILRRLRDVLGE